MSRGRLLELLRAWSFREGDFTLASGAHSRFYVDVRRTALTGEGADLLGPLLLAEIEAAGWLATVEGVGGMTLGADPLTTAVGGAAWRSGRRLGQFLVRKAPKDHGTGRQVERGAELPESARVVLLEDTVTTGGSTLRACEAVRREGLQVIGAVCVVDRGEGGALNLERAGVPLRSLFTLEDLRT